MYLREIIAYDKSMVRALHVSVATIFILIVCYKSPCHLLIAGNFSMFFL